MPIPVTCQCGQSFAAGDHLAGRTVQCPKCKSPLAIPNPQAAPASGPAMGPSQVAASGPSIFDDAGMRTFTPGRPTCPSCNADLPPNAILCVKCGHHLKLGRRIGADPGVAGGGDGHGSLAAIALAKAAALLEEEKENAKKEYKQGMPWWAVAGIFLFALAFLIGMLMLPGHQAFQYGGVTIFAVAWLVSLYHSIKILIIAFTDNVVHGLACLFVPCYTLVYVIMHWDKCGAHFLWQLMMGFVAGIGMGMMTAAPHLKPGLNDDAFFRPRRHPPSVLVVSAADYGWPRHVLRNA